MAHRRDVPRVLQLRSRLRLQFPRAPDLARGQLPGRDQPRDREGSRDGVDLAGAKVSWALWWPGAIHEKGGRGHAYVDASDEQYEALERIWRGEEGYGLFEIFNSTLDEPTAVERATLDITVDGKRSSVKIEGVSENQMTPLTNPVTGDENEVRIVKTTGFIWRDGEIAESERFQIELPEMSWDLANRHCVFSQFDYTNA